MAYLCSNKTLLLKIGNRTTGCNHQPFIKKKKYFHEHGVGNDFMKKMQKALTITEEMDKLNIKILKII